MFRNLVEFSSLRGHVPPRVHIEAHFPAMLGLVDALVGLLDDSAVRYSSKATCAPTVASNFFSIYLSLYVSSCLSRCLFRSLSFSLYGAVSLFSTCVFVSTSLFSALRTRRIRMPSLVRHCRIASAIGLVQKGLRSPVGHEAHYLQAAVV